MKEAYKTGLNSRALDRKLGNPFDLDDRNPYDLTNLRRRAFEKGYNKGYYG